MSCLLLAVVLTGCGEKTAEKTAEKAIETSTGGSVDVDIEEDSMKINTNAGSMEVGESVSLPAGFPSDVHVVDGTVISATTITEGEVYAVSVETTKSVSAVKTEYENELEKDGWTTTMSLTIQDRSVSVTIGESDGKTIVSIGTSKNE